MISSTALRILRSLIPILPLLLNSANAAEALQIQATADGDVQVDVIQVAADRRILTVQLAYRNTSNVDVGIKYRVSGVYYIDERERRKYPVLKGSSGEWVAAPTASGNIATQNG
jgi:hypothetical protein